MDANRRGRGFLGGRRLGNAAARNMSGVGQRPAAATSATASRGDMPTTGGASRGGAYASPGTNEPVMPVPVDTPKQVRRGAPGRRDRWPGPSQA